MPRKKLITKSNLMPTVLIAGGAGFVGSHIAEAFLNKGARVIVLDDYRSGKEIYVNHLLKNSNFALFDVDINKALPKDIESVDYVIHLAGLEEYLYKKQDPNLEALLTNAVGTKSLLDLSLRSQAKFLLVSTIDVYEGMMSQLDLTAYFGKTLVEEKKYSLTEAKRYAEALVWEYHKRYDANVRIVRFPEVYGSRMNLEASGSLGVFIKNLLDGKDIIVDGDGSQKEYYLYILDAVSGILKSLFEVNTKGKIYSLVPEHATTVLETAFLLKSLADQPLDIKFGSGKKLNQFSQVPDTLTLSELGWKPRTPFKQGVMKTLESFDYTPNEDSFKHTRLIRQKMASKNTLEKVNSIVNFKNASVLKLQAKINRPVAEVSLSKSAKGPLRTRIGVLWPYALVSVLSFFLVFIIFPLTSIAINMRVISKNIDVLPNLVFQLQTDKAEYNAQEVNKSLTSIRKHLSDSKWMFSVFGKGEDYKSYSQLTSSLIYFSQAVEGVINLVEPYSNLWESLSPDSTETFNPEGLDDSKLYVSNARNNIQLALSDFKYVDFGIFPEFVKKSIENYGNILSTSTTLIDKVWTLTSELPGVLGFDAPKKYLVLFQNNNEIRPTGGFIGSYAVVELESGKITELKIDDIYNPDGQIDTRGIAVTPPKPIGDFLLEDRLYMRNANWDPDFPTSAEVIKNLYYRITGETISGVMVLDLEAVKNLLDVTGPIFLTAYNEEITSDNLYERAQYHSSFAYNDGSQQKRQFLTVLGGKLMETLFVQTDERAPNILNTLLDSLKKRHISLYIPEGMLGNLIKEEGWDGSLVDTNGDYLQVVNANLGGTKSNYYVKNNISYHIVSKTRDGLLRAELHLNYNHTGTDESWPGGPYTDYVRVLTQKGARLTDAEIKYESGLGENIYNQIVTDKVGRYSSFETSFVLQPSSKVELVFYYDLPEELSITKDQKNYSLVWQKQAGTSKDVYEFTLNTPFGMEVEKGTDNIEFVDKVVKSSGTLDQDVKVSVVLQ